VQAFLHLKICFMKAKFPILIAAGLFLVSVSKAQYGGGYSTPHIAIHGQVVIPGAAYVHYGYDNYARDRYVGRREWRADEYDRFCWAHRDWREDEYQRYCRDHREFRGDRNDYYQDHYSYRAAPYCAPRRVVAYGY
jgi:hypothetical protein